VTLEEILMGTQPTAYTGGGRVPVQAQTGGLTIDPAIQAQIDAISQPETFTPEAVPEKSKLWQKLLSALADAGSTYATGMGAGRPTSFTRSLLERDREADEIGVRNKLGRQKSTSDSARKKAELKLQALLREQERSLGATASKAEQEAAERKLKEGRQYAEGVAAQERQQRLADDAVKMAAAERKQKLDFAHDEAMERLRSKLRPEHPDKDIAKDQMKSISEAKAGINSIAVNIKAAAEKFGGRDGVRTFIRRKLEELNLDKDGMAAAMTYYDKEVEQQFDLDEFGGPPLKPGSGY
jgi:hypothetical protein